MYNMKGKICGRWGCCLSFCQITDWLKNLGENHIIYIISIFLINTFSEKKSIYEKYTYEK